MEKKLFYKTTGIFIDWDQLKKIPHIDIYIDIGFGPSGSPHLIKKFNRHNTELILIDPLKESESFAESSLKKEDYTFYRCAVGSYNGSLKLHVEKNLGRSTLLKVTNINFNGPDIDNRKVNLQTLDAIMKNHVIKKIKNKKRNMKIGIKIDTEGYELEVIKGAVKTLKKTEFVLLEARHNHISFNRQYKLSKLMKLMSDNRFFLERIITAKPFISDLYFVRFKKI